MTVNAIIQARCGSTRFPNKVFCDIDGRPLLWHVVNRLTGVGRINDIIVATTVSHRDDGIEAWCTAEKVKCFRGSEEDVLNRYFEAAMAYPSDVVVRITADDPFKEPSVMEQVIATLIDGDYDLVTNNSPPSFPEGLDCEAMTMEALRESERFARDPFEREHVTQYIYRHPERFRIGNIASPENLSRYRWTIDTEEDYQMVKAIFAGRKKGQDGMLLMDEILEILAANPSIQRINASVKRSAMYL